MSSYERQMLFKRISVNLCMNLQAEKIELVKLLLDTEDKTVIQKIKEIFNAQEKDFSENLPDYVKDGIKKSRKQAKDGQLIPFEQFIEELKHI